MQPHRILIVVTSADRMGTAPEPTGLWLEEIAAPYYTFIDTRCEVTIASPKGGKTPIDPTSLEAEYQSASTRRFDADKRAQHALAHTLKLSAITPANYDAIYFPGGHGTMEDFPNNVDVKTVVESFHRSGKLVASVCHGVACLISATNARGEPLVKSHRFTCFSDEEERGIPAGKHVPFMLESELTKQGGIASTAAPFTAHIVIDRQLFTGQNPASSIPLAEAVIHQLRQRMAA